MKRIGILPEPNRIDSLKKHLLYFDELYLAPHSDNYSVVQAGTDFPEMLDLGVVNYLSITELAKDLEIASEDLKPLKASTSNLDIANVKKLFERKVYDAIANYVETQFSNDHAVSVISKRFAQQTVTEERELSRHKTLMVVLNSMPVIDDKTVPFKQVLDFRNDSEAQARFLALRNWMIELSSQNLSETEVVEKIEYLLNEYQRSLEYHRMQFEHGVLRVCVSTAAEVLENLIKFNWSSAAEAIFQLTDQNVKALAAASKLEGREVAYLYEARREFG